MIITKILFTKFLLIDVYSLMSFDHSGLRVQLFAALNIAGLYICKYIASHASRAPARSSIAKAQV